MLQIFTCRNNFYAHTSVFLHFFIFCVVPVGGSICGIIFLSKSPLPDDPSGENEFFFHNKY